MRRWFRSSNFFSALTTSAVKATSRSPGVSASRWSALAAGAGSWRTGVFPWASAKRFALHKSMLSLKSFLRSLRMN